MSATRVPSSGHIIPVSDRWAAKSEGGILLAPLGPQYLAFRAPWFSVIAERRLS